MLKTTSVVPAPLLEVTRPLILLLAPWILPLNPDLLLLPPELLLLSPETYVEVEAVAPGQEVAPRTPPTGLRVLHLCFLWCHISSEFVTERACKPFEAPSLLKIFAHYLFF